MNKSHDAVGAEKLRYREIAREYTTKAAELYQGKVKGKISGAMQRLSDALGVNLREYASSEQPTKREQQRKGALMRESLNVATKPGMSKADTAKMRRDKEADAILNSPIGSRIYAGLVDVWAQPTFEDGEIKMHRTREDINNSIMEYFGVSSMMDVIEMMEQKVDLYADPQSMERYDMVSMTIANSLYE